MIFILDLKSYNYTPTIFFWKTAYFSGFLFVLRTFLELLISSEFILTLTRPIPENFAGVPASWLGAPAFFFCIFLDCLGHEAAHSLGGILLHFSGHVGIGVQREARAVVAQDAGHRFGVHALLDR